MAAQKSRMLTILLTRQSTNLNLNSDGQSVRKHDASNFRMERITTDNI